METGMNGKSGLPPSINNQIVAAGFLVIFGMMACFSWMAAGLAQKIFQSWDAGGILVLSLLATVEALASYQLVRNSPMIQKQLANFYVTEWLVNLVVIKVFTELKDGAAHLWENVSIWPVNFPINILTGEFFLNAFLVYATWQISTLFISDLYRMGIEETAPVDDRPANPSGRETIRRRFLVMGMVITLFAGIQLHGVTSLGWVFLPTQILVVVVLFFILGFCLLSLAKFANLQISWMQAKVTVPAQIPRRWIFYSLLALGILAVLAVWLPTAYTMGFFETITYILQLFVALGNIIVVLLLILFGILTGFFASLLRIKTSPGTAVPTPEPARIVPHGAASISTGDAIRSIIFWAALLTLAFIVIRQYLAFNRNLVIELKRYRFINWLAARLNQLKSLFRRANRRVATLVKNSLERLRGTGKTNTGMDQWDYLNVRKLSTRQKIFFYYYALVRRAGDAGLPRREGQTPYEYARSLTSRLHGEKDGLNDITESFVEARYSRHAIPDETARRMRFLWERFRNLLRNIRTPGQGKNSSDRD
jgi:hypothetical protein